MNFAQLKKSSKKISAGFPVIKVAVLCDFASQFLVQAFQGYGIEHGIKYDVFEADYNQVDRQIMDPTSEFYAFRPQFAVIIRSSEHLLKDFYKIPLEQRAEFAARQLAHTGHLYNTIVSRLDCKVIMNTYPEINDRVFGNFGAKVKSSFIYQIRSLNLSLMDLSRSCKQLFLADFNTTIGHSGISNSFDPKMYIHADMVYNLDILPYLVKDIHDIIQAVNGRFKKCLILDLDNTVWGGIIGDDGMEGIQIGDLGLGKAFTDLQLWAKELKNRGVLLAVCSKNTEAIAKEPFESHPDMVLKLSDIAIFVANWENKVDNIRNIQSILNISFDSMVFVDDNPFEREMVKQAIPDLTVPPLPEDPSEYMPFLKALNLFETASFTEEDLERTAQYQVEAKRNILQQSYDSEEKFLESLQMRSKVRPFDPFIGPRVAQLSQRSNQFNLRTVRYTEEDIARLASSVTHSTISFTLEDTYGNYGLIAFVILQHADPETLFIDSWVMSCRVLKRGMERFTLNKIVEAGKHGNFKQIVGEYIPTPKNGLVKDHYAALGFQPLDNNRWSLQINDYPMEETKMFIQAK